MLVSLLLMFSRPLDGCFHELLTLPGTGTVLDAMALNVPLIVVPNPALQDNHQVELAKELDRQGYALHGDVEYEPPLPPFILPIQTDLTTKACFPSPSKPTKPKSPLSPLTRPPTPSP